MGAEGGRCQVRSAELCHVARRVLPAGRARHNGRGPRSAGSASPPRPATAGGDFRLDIRELAWHDEGWPVATTQAEQEAAGENPVTAVVSQSALLSRLG